MEAGYKQHFLFNVAPYLLQPKRLTPALKQCREVIHLGGITTAADMAAGAMNLDQEFASVQSVYENDETPFRVLYIPVGSEIIASRYGGLEQVAEFYKNLPERNTHRLRWVKQVKFLADGAFYSQLIQMEDEIGSITAGKIADLTVLEQDPYEVAPEKLKDIPIWGTVFEGKLFPI